MGRAARIALGERLPFGRAGVVWLDGKTGEVVGRADHQGPEVDGTTTLVDCDARVGDLVDAEVVASEGVDLVARPLGAVR